MQRCESRHAGLFDGSPSRDVGEYRLGRELGRGGFSVVRLATRIATGQRMACKVVDTRKMECEESVKKQKRGWKESLCLEIAAMSVIRHENVACAKGVRTTGRYIYIFMDLSDAGTLFDRIEGTNGVTEDVAADYLAQLILGVNCVHQFGVAHRDLKPENILLDSKGVIQLTDFGLCKLHSRTNTERVSENAVGTKQYVAPESLGTGPHDAFVADLWSLGVVIYVMLTGQFPFYDEDDRVLAGLISAGCPSVESWPMSSDARDIVQSLLTVDASKRATLAQLWQHTFLSFEVGRRVEDLRAKGRLHDSAQCPKVHSPSLPHHDDAKGLPRSPKYPMHHLPLKMPGAGGSRSN
ncbi:CBL-interacting protein kinase 23 [Diplonema papillatum]|nr:CBL-interacting protein kinase 23 [Diplonema papillatum]